MGLNLNFGEDLNLATSGELGLELSPDNASASPAEPEVEAEPNPEVGFNGAGVDITNEWRLSVGGDLYLFLDFGIRGQVLNKG